MFHMELFSSADATSGANTFIQLTYFTPDNVLPKLVNGMQVSGSLPFLHSVAGVGTSMVHIRAQAPSMLPFPYTAMSPNNRGSAFESPPRIWDFSRTPVPLRVTEEFDIFVSQNSGGSETEYVAVQFCDGPGTPLSVVVNPPSIVQNQTTPGRFFTVHATASTTLTAGKWTQVQPSFDQALPAGSYAVVGARAFSATALFFRLYPAMAPLWRPGGVAVQAYDQMDAYNQRYIASYGAIPASWGVWMTFYQNVPPQIEFFATSADTAEEMWLDLVYLGPQTTPGA